ncbi:MAG: glycosyltransferase [Candidatus Omnitrophica bacterium]|nr:glycosyltransferase [Candidatus Omnitrophota bacterium]MDD5553683.1 glycosyltransferase [Candidatus Omnitrophota bacterium]
MKDKIAIISLHGSPLAALGGTDSGGQNVYVMQIAKNLSKHFFVDVFTRKTHPNEKPIVRKNGFRVVHIDAGPAAPIPKEKLLPFIPEFSLGIRNFIKKNKMNYKVLHANFFDSGQAGMEIKKELGIPIIVTFHALGKIRRQYQGAQDRFPDIRFSVEEDIMRFSDGIIAECPQDKEDMISLYGADPKKIQIIPCGYDPEELKPISKAYARSLLGLSRKKKIILQLGRIVQRKGIENVIHALMLLVKFYSYDSQLLIVGGETRHPDAKKTPEIGRLARVIKRLGLSKRVHFLGRADRNWLKFFYSAADVFVSTPWYEPFGITPLEAMACKVPVVGSAVGGIKYSVVDRKTGFLVPPEEPGFLASRLAMLMALPQQAARMGEEGFLRVSSVFTWKKVAKAVSRFYKDVAK